MANTKVKISLWNILFALFDVVKQLKEVTVDGKITIQESMDLILIFFDRTGIKIETAGLDISKYIAQIQMAIDNQLNNIAKVSTEVNKELDKELDNINKANDGGDE